MPYRPTWAPRTGQSLHSTISAYPGIRKLSHSFVVETQLSGDAARWLCLQLRFEGYHQRAISRMMHKNNTGIPHWAILSLYTMLNILSLYTILNILGPSISLLLLLYYFTIRSLDTILNILGQSIPSLLLLFHYYRSHFYLSHKHGTQAHRGYGATGPYYPWMTDNMSLLGLLGLQYMHKNTAWC